MSDELTKLIESMRSLLRNHQWTPEEIRAHAISFAYGNVHLHNPAITREGIAAEYDKLHPEKP
jgi:hypothetical protein